MDMMILVHTLIKNDKSFILRVKVIKRVKWVNLS
jgi:hypothetical protein